MQNTFIAMSKLPNLVTLFVQYLVKAVGQIDIQNTKQEAID